MSGARAGEPGHGRIDGRRPRRAAYACRAWATLLLALCAVGCSDSLGFGTGIPELRILGSSYRPGDTIRAELVNRSPRVVEYGCGVALERRTSEAWVTAIPEPQLCAAALRLLGAGSMASRQLPLPDSLSGGVYRLRAMIMLRGKPPASPVFSPTFRVVDGD